MRGDFKFLDNLNPTKKVVQIQPMRVVDWTVVSRYYFSYVFFYTNIMR